ncbi:MAG: DNA repair protein RecN [Fusobacteriia bacterium 4572_74]|nr:MAG: DNA repair protein RecN [Fusobacteriia bacterium 4572_74]
MLRELRIENLAIIDKLELEFQDKLIALEKTNMEMLRDGAEYLLAEGVFDADENQVKEFHEMGIDVENNEIIVQRRMESNGRGKAFVNGRRVPMSNLKEIMGTLVDIVGQRSHQMLLHRGNHIKLIDRFLNKDEHLIKDELGNIVSSYEDIRRLLIQLSETRNGIKEKKDLYEYQLTEIEEMNLSENEDEELEDEYKILFNAGKITEKLKNSYFSISDGEINVTSLLHGVKKNMEFLSQYGKDYEIIFEKVEKIYYEIEDLTYNIENIQDSMGVDEYRLNAVVDRLDKINNLKKKYGENLTEILEYRDKIKSELDLLDESDFEEKKLNKNLEDLLKKYKEVAIQLSTIRKVKAKMIEKNLTSELIYLNMKDSKFRVDFKVNEKISRSGMDIVEFMIAPNLGQEMKPLAKVVSGGEMSRIMLALKVIFSAVDNIPILVFDEIDTGVGGETVRKIADKLYDIGENAQIICITHSPAIAAKASQQFYIEKKNIQGKTIATVKNLDPEERIDEIVRMLAGDQVSESVRNHAKDLLKGRDK